MLVWDVQKAKGVFLRIYRLTGDWGFAAEKIKRHIGTVYLWARSDAAFQSEIDEIKEMWEGIKDGTLRNLDLKAIEVVNETLDGDFDQRLKAELSMKILRAHGFMPEKVAMEHQGPGGGPIPISTVVVREPVEVESNVQDSGDGIEEMVE